MFRDAPGVEMNPRMYQLPDADEQHIHIHIDHPGLQPVTQTYGEKFIRQPAQQQQTSDAENIQKIGELPPLENNQLRYELRDMEDGGYEIVLVSNPDDDTDMPNQTVGNNSTTDRTHIHRLHAPTGDA